MINSISGLYTTEVVAKASSTDDADDKVENAGNGMGKLMFIILLALIAVATIYHFGKEDKKRAVSEREESSFVYNAVGRLDSLTGQFIYNEGTQVSIYLPDGAGKMEVGEFSTENKLNAFLKDPTARIDTVQENCFEFTNVRFKTGSSELTDESMFQLKNVTAITKAYPLAIFEIVGYTDNRGSALANVALSQKRADAVLAVLTKLGANPKSFTGAKGYGPEWPIAENTSPEGRAQNQRVAVIVKAK